MVTLPVAVCALLDAPNPAVVVTSDAAGMPQASVVWIAREGNDVAFFCEVDTQKVRNLRARPDVVVIVMDPAQEFEPGARCYVRFTGSAEIVEPEDSTFIDGLASVYMDLPHFPHPGEYVKVRVAVRKMTGLGPEVDGVNSGWGV